MALHTALQESAAAFPDRPWLQFEGASWSYGEGAEISERIAANLLAAGIEPGDRVALLFANCPELVFCYFACFRIGAVAVPLNTRFQPAELVYAIHHAGARLLIGQAALCNPLLELRGELPNLANITIAGTKAFDDLYREGATAPIFPTVDHDRLAALLYTSGTTAKPKGVMQTHATLGQQSANYLAALGRAVFAQTLIVVPLCHISGFSVMLLSATMAAGTITLLPRFEPTAMLEAMARTRTTASGGLPVMVNALVNAASPGQYDMGALRLFIAGGDCVPLELQHRFQALFGVPVDELCGMTEIMYCVQPYLMGQRRPGSIGKPFGDVRLRLVDGEGRDVAPGAVGEIIAYSAALTPGYWNDPVNTAAAIKDGGMQTGDLARMDQDGFYWFAGRTKDIIIRGGSNISPGEVEDVLYAHPSVYEASVVGAPCAELGQRVRAYVVLKPGAQTSADELQQWTGKSIAAYKVPESIIFETELPKGPTGKILRKALRDRAAAD